VGRYRLLETVRDYARVMLGSTEEVDGMQSRHLVYFTELGETAEPQLMGTDQRTWLEKLEAEHDNIRAALEWSAGSEPDAGLRLAGAIWRFWYVRSHFGEGRRHLEGTLSAATPGSRTAYRALALNGAGVLANQLGDLDSARVA